MNIDDIEYPPMPNLPEGWRRKAACWDKGTEIFYIEGAGGGMHYQEARKICAVCTVKQECLIECAVFEHSRYEYQGYRGGMSPYQRVQWLPTNRKRLLALGGISVEDAA